jgi:hypothetical protein
MIESNGCPEPSLFLQLRYQPNLVLYDSSTSCRASVGSNSSPQVDEGFATTWSISCVTHNYYSVGEIVIKQNTDNTINCVDMKLYGCDMSDKSKWIGFTKTNGFSNNGDPSYFYVNGFTWVLGPGGKPDGLESPAVTDISGAPKSHRSKKSQIQA